jgi:hypothetical protein
MNALNRRATSSVLSAPIHVRWTGASGAAYVFELNAIGTPYNPLPGVYIFCHFGPQNALVADYIGDADDFSRRLDRELTSHREWKNVQAAGATHICTLHVPGKAAERVKVETDLRRAVLARKSRMAA